MGDNFLNVLIKDPDAGYQLTLKSYIDLYTNVVNEQTNKDYIVTECIDYLLKNKQITEINIKLTDELCVFMDVLKID